MLSYSVSGLQRLSDIIVISCNPWGTSHNGDSVNITVFAWQLNSEVLH